MPYMQLDKMVYDQEKSLDHEDAGDSLLPESQTRVTPTRRRRHNSLTVVSYIITALVAYSIGALSGSKVLDRDTLCTHHVSQDSPLLRDVSLRYTTQQFNGSLFKENIFRQSASPEVDEAWESLGVNYRSVSIPEEYAEQAGFRKDQVRINRKYGGGYPANVEGLHQLHCLNLVRQSLYYNYEYYKKQGKGAFLNEDYVVKAHVSHCLDIVRQQLMCTIDVGFLGQIWTNPEAPRPFVDFNTKHKCRNFDAVRQWAEQHQLPEVTELESDFLEPPQLGDLIYAEIP